MNMAEREGFEPPIALRLCLISSQVHSTGLCHLSVYQTHPGLYESTGKGVSNATLWDLSRKLVETEENDWLTVRHAGAGLDFF
jgi:hypothetical protein